MWFFCRHRQKTHGPRPAPEYYLPGHTMPPGNQEAPPGTMLFRGTLKHDIFLHQRNQRARREHGHCRRKTNTQRPE